MKSLGAVLAFAVLFALPAAAGEQTLEHWLNLNATGRFQAVGATTPSPAIWFLEAQPRFLIWEPKPEELVLRAAVGWELAPHLIVLGGAGAIPEFEAPSWLINETRLWQQVGYTQALDRFTLMGRARLEERLFAAKEPSMRTRLQARVAYKLPVAEDQVSLFVSDELFLRFDTDVYDQNRASAGVAYKFAPWLSVELGYINVIKNNPLEDDGQVRHVLAVTTAINLL